ncbi:hypothetical protein [Maricaulis sp.]|uniref:hypothetical protein n=1 Tax=Maricaulis sp. TaxID=1486257 RepID=UPI003A9553BE
MARLSILVPTALFLLAGCASHDGPPPGERGGRPDGNRGGASGFDMAVQLVDRGEYQEALPILRCVAGQGSGFEIAQYLAGYSAIRLATAETTPAILRDEMRVEGFDRLTSAAQAGWPTAQAELAVQFASLDSAEAPERAAYWAAVYRRNARDRTYGLDRLDDGIEARIASRIDAAQTAEIENQAAMFIIEPLTAIAATPACTPYLGSPSFGQQRGGRGQGRGRGGRGGGGGGGGRGGPSLQQG